MLIYGFIVFYSLMSGLHSLNFSARSRIIGGRSVNISDVPFMVAIIEAHQFICGGSYIKPRWVLTAAHCIVQEFEDVPEAKDKFVLKMGVTKWRDARGQKRKSEDLYIYSRLTDDLNEPDIGLIKIDRPFKVGRNVRVITLSDHKLRIVNELATVAGWGTTSLQQESTAKSLLTVQQPVINNLKCTQIYVRRNISVKLSKGKVICTNLEYTGACDGDSGSPLVLAKKNVQIGLVAWNEDCGMSAPTVYTDVSYYRRWIESITGPLKRSLGSKHVTFHAASIAFFVLLLYHKLGLNA